MQGEAQVEVEGAESVRGVARTITAAWIGLAGSAGRHRDEAGPGRKPRVGLFTV